MKKLSLNKKGLKEFIDSEEYGSLRNLPISRIRAISHIANPRAEDDDILLVAIINNDRTIGYLGALPDDCFDEDGNKSHFGWLSCFWVDEMFRDQNIAAQLFMTMMQAWNNRLSVTNIVPSLESVYGKMRLFAPVKKEMGLRYYFRFNMATILPPKSKVFKTLKFALAAFDTIANGVYSVFARSKQDTDSQYTVSNSLDEESLEFIKAHPSHNVCGRGSRDIEWILNHPWIKNTGDKDEAKKYYFSSLDESFSQIIMKVKDAGKTVAVLLLNLRKNCVATPYLFTDHSSDVNKIAAECLLDFCKKNKVDMLTVFNPQLLNELKLISVNAIHQKEVTKPYFLGKQVSPLQNDKIWFQDGDGDGVFC